MTSHSSLPSRISFFCEVIFLRTSRSAFSSSWSVAVRICTTCWRIVSRSSTNSTSSLETSTSVIWWEIRTIFSRLSRIPVARPQVLKMCNLYRPMELNPAQPGVAVLPQNQLAITRQLLLHLFVHFLVRDTRPAHFVLMLGKDLAHFFVQPVLDGDLFHHALPQPLRNGLRSLRLNQLPFNKPLHHFRCHVSDVIACNQHPRMSPLRVSKRKSLLAAPPKCKAGRALVAQPLLAVLWVEALRVAALCVRVLRAVSLKKPHRQKCLCYAQRKAVTDDCGCANQRKEFNLLFLKAGGARRNRTADKGFADLCLTTWRPRPVCEADTMAHFPGAEQLPHDRSPPAQANDCGNYSIIAVASFDENFCGVIKKRIRCSEIASKVAAFGLR